MSLHVYAEMEQRSPEWYAARCGIVTASTMTTLVSIGTPDALAVECPTCDAAIGGPCLAVGRKIPTEIKTVHADRSAAASNLPPTYTPATGDSAKALHLALAAERIADNVEEMWPTRDMQRGIFAEPYAREMYADHYAYAPVTEIGFMVRELDGFKIGYSPDGLVGDDGLIEIKAPRQKGHVAAVIEDGVPAQHMAQMQTGLLVSGRDWIDFISYNGGMALWQERVYPDPAWQGAIVAAAEQAEQAIAEMVAAYQTATTGCPVATRIDFNQEIF